MVLSASLANIKPKQYSQTWQWNKQPYDLTQKLQGINPMGLSAPWVDYKNKQLFTTMKI